MRLQIIFLEWCWWMTGVVCLLFYSPYFIAYIITRFCCLLILIIKWPSQLEIFRRGSMYLLVLFLGKVLVRIQDFFFLSEKYEFYIFNNLDPFVKQYRTGQDMTWHDGTGCIAFDMHWTGTRTHVSKTKLKFFVPHKKVEQGWTHTRTWSLV